MKDLFSDKSDHYARYRPDYPEELFVFLNTLVENKESAWDCGTGNGQVALRLCGFFHKVEATDISENQMAHALQKRNIHYSVQAAEKTDFPDHCFDLISVAQAIHWFDFDAFYKEVKRTLKPGGVLAVIGYGRIVPSDGAFGLTQDDRIRIITHNLNGIIQFLYSDILGGYWDSERKYIDEEYQTIPFPFAEIESPKLFIEKEWSLNHLMGYFGTWSAVKHYRKESGKDPLPEVERQLQAIWGDEEQRRFRFPVYLRVGR